MSEPRAITPGRGTSVPARRGDSLADVLERVLDKGIVIAGDIRVDLLDIELLTIRIRLLVSSADKAQELGMAWWQGDPFYTGQATDAPQGNGDDQGSVTGDTVQRLVEGTQQLADRVARLEGGDGSPSGERRAARRGDDAGGAD